MTAITATAAPAARGLAAGAPARTVYVCANPLCGSVASYPGTCRGRPMVAR